MKVKFSIAAGLLMASAVTANASAEAKSENFDPDAISETVRVLSSDEFEGRGPGTAGEDRTLAFLIERFAKMGLEPGTPEGRWLQSVDIIRLTRPEDGKFNLASAIGERNLVDGEQAVVVARVPGKVQISNAKIVFVGYGLLAPQIGWDDLKEVDLRGKVVMYIGARPAAAGFDDLSSSQDATMQARLERYVERGAAGAVFFYPGSNSSNWQTWVNTRRVAQYQKPLDWWPTANGNAPAVVQIPEDVARSIFTDANADWEAAMADAERSDFIPFELKDIRLSAEYEVIGERVTTHNVLAKRTGSTRPEEAVLYSAHWDHLGRGLADESGDDIYNGAVDNAAGVAGLLEIAQAFAQEAPTERSVIFLATTGEELGFWGIRAYAANPTISLAKTAAVLNMDTATLGGPTRTARIRAVGSTSIDSNEAVLAAAEQERTIEGQTPDPARYYYRSDHIVLSRLGVPSFYLGWGQNRINEGHYAGEDFASYYHHPNDEWSAELDWRGSAQDFELLFKVGRLIADGANWPEWSPDNIYRTVREETADQRQ